MRRRGPAMLVPLLSLCAACAPGYRVETLEPGFDGTRTYRMQGNVLAAGEALEFNVQRVDSLRKDPHFQVRIEYSGLNELYIRSGESLTVIVDGDSIRLQTLPGSAEERVLGGSRPVEAALYPVEPEQLRRLAAGERVEVRVRGRSRTEQRRFDARNLHNLRDFITHYVDAAPPRPYIPPPLRKDGG